MVKKKFILFRDQIRDFCRKGWESKVIRVKGDIILVEAEVPEEAGDISAYRMEEMINEPGEC
jgi:hypothetical protein